MKYIKNINESIDDKNITIIRTDDWEGVYYKNKLIDEGHNVDWEGILRNYFGIIINSQYIEIDEFEENFGSNCPENLDEVKTKLDAKKYNL